MYTIYYNPACSKCRSTLDLLRNHDIEPEIIPYLEQGLTADEITDLAKLAGVGVRDLLRKTETSYQDLNLGADNLCDEEIIHAIANTPALLQRPIVIRNNEVAIIARPPELAKKLITQTV